MSLNFGACLNLTDKQMDLLRLLASNHKRHGGVEFIFSHSYTNTGLTYSGKGSFLDGYDEFDFKRLQSENLIDLIPVDNGILRGKPTSLGIAIVDDDSHNRKRPMIANAISLPPTAETTMDYYPPEFSSQAKALVEAERLRAGRDVERYRKEPRARPARPNGWETPWHFFTEYEQDLQEYILRVFLMFARQACALGRKGLWSVDVVRAQSCEFLRRFTIQAILEKGHDISGRWISNWDGGIESEVQRSFEKWDLWRDFEDLLLELADFQAGVREPLAGQSPAPTARNRPGPKPDYETAARVAAIVKEFGGSNWRPKLSEICCELDDAKITRPKTWRERGHNSWFDCLTAERDLVVKAIEHQLELAAASLGETLS